MSSMSAKIQSLHLMFRCSAPAWWQTATRSCMHSARACENFNQATTMICWCAFLVTDSPTDLQLRPGDAFEKYRSFWADRRGKLLGKAKGVLEMPAFLYFGMDGRERDESQERRNRHVQDTSVQPLASSKDFGRSFSASRSGWFTQDSAATDDGSRTI